MDFNRNNLDKSTSPYLLQHINNPVWWQEWGVETLEYARKSSKLIFISVGYTTCHWCHVMAEEVFNSPEAAEVLNKDFISVKVDKEQRPDIDRFLTSLSLAITGSSGWPLNAFLTPDMKPIIALTYVPLKAKNGMIGFLDLLSRINNVYKERSDQLEHFEIPIYTSGTLSDQGLNDSLLNSFDMANGGTSPPKAPKFPPHALLLFSLYYQQSAGMERLEEAIRKTLDSMLLGGLHDHLQGGFFRYCVDENWTIPHFEKMLQDQALLLWCYSLAYSCFHDDVYGNCAKKIIKCLEETFENSGVFYTGHDADVDHKEGEVYLWEEKELRRILNDTEFMEMTEVYAITTQGNFEEKNHLIKKSTSALPNIENKLLSKRKKRPQPIVDEKIVTDLNALTGIGYIHAYRGFGETEYLKKAELIFNEIIRLHYIDNSLFHSSFNGIVSTEQFMQDYAALLLFLTFLHEDTLQYSDYLQIFYDKLLTFKRNEIWIESDNPDFFTMPSETLDHSHPASASLAEVAIARTKILLNHPYENREFHEPLSNSFLNVSALICNGFFYIIKTPKQLGWLDLPVNSIQIKDDKINTCYQGICTNELPRKKEW